jgi:hypothetical protein
MVSLGYVLTRLDDPNVKRERLCEIEVGLPGCRCSNCVPLTEAGRKNLINLSIENLDSYLNNQHSLIALENNTILTQTNQPTAYQPGSCNKPLIPAVWKEYASQLVRDYKVLFLSKYDTEVFEIQANGFFNLEMARGLVLVCHNDKETFDIDKFMGREMIRGQNEWLKQAMKKYESSEKYAMWVTEKEKYNNYIINEMKRLQQEKEEQANQA